MSTSSASYVPPNQHKHLRACMVCSIVQTYTRFVKEGCPNCDAFLHLQGSPDMVGDCTSQVFEGLITLSEPSKSWVAKWQRIDKFVKGVYAVKVSGILSEEVRDLVEAEGGVRYLARDGGDEDDI